MPKTIRPRLADEKPGIGGVFTRNRQRVTQLNREENRKLSARVQNLKKLSMNQTEKLNRSKKQMTEKAQHISAYQTALEAIRVENFESLKTAGDGDSGCAPDSERRRSLEFHLLRYGFDCPQMKKEIKRIREEKDPTVMRMRRVELLKAIEKSKSDLLLSRRESNAEVVDDFRRRRNTVVRESIYKLTEVPSRPKQSKASK